LKYLTKVFEDKGFCLRLLKTIHRQHRPTLFLIVQQHMTLLKTSLLLGSCWKKIEIDMNTKETCGTSKDIPIFNSVLD